MSQWKVTENEAGQPLILNRAAPQAYLIKQSALKHRLDPECPFRTLQEEEEYYEILCDMAENRRYGCIKPEWDEYAGDELWYTDVRGYEAEIGIKGEEFNSTVYDNNRNAMVFNTREIFHGMIPRCIEFEDSIAEYVEEKGAEECWNTSI